MKNLQPTIFSLRFRNYFKKHLIFDKGYSAGEAKSTLSKMKVYIDRLKGIADYKEFCSCSTTEQMRGVINRVFDKWQGHIADNYQHMPEVFNEYLDFFSNPSNVVACTKEDTSHNYQRSELLLQVGNTVKEYYNSFDAICDVINLVGIEAVYQKQLSVRNTKLLLKYVPVGQGKNYKAVDSTYYLCTKGNLDDKIKLIRLIAIQFHIADVKASRISSERTKATFLDSKSEPFNWNRSAL